MIYPAVKPTYNNHKKKEIKNVTPANNRNTAKANQSKAVKVEQSQNGKSYKLRQETATTTKEESPPTENIDSYHVESESNNYKGSNISELTVKGKRKPKYSKQIQNAIRERHQQDNSRVTSLTNHIFHSRKTVRITTAEIEKYDDSENMPASYNSSESSEIICSGSYDDSIKEVKLVTKLQKGKLEKCAQHKTWKVKENIADTGSLSESIEEFQEHYEHDTHKSQPLHMNHDRKEEEEKDSVWDEISDITGYEEDSKDEKVYSEELEDYSASEKTEKKRKLRKGKRKQDTDGGWSQIYGEKAFGKQKHKQHKDNELLKKGKSRSKGKPYNPSGIRIGKSRPEKTLTYGRGGRRRNDRREGVRGIKRYGRGIKRYGRGFTRVGGRERDRRGEFGRSRDFNVDRQYRRDDSRYGAERQYSRDRGLQKVRGYVKEKGYGGDRGYAGDRRYGRIQEDDMTGRFSHIRSINRREGRRGNKYGARIEENEKVKKKTKKERARKKEKRKKGIHM